MLILDALFALFLYKLLGVNALYILGAICCIAFLRSLEKIVLILTTCGQLISISLAEQLEKKQDAIN